MKSFGTDIDITQGESFTIDYTIVDENNDNKPYIILEDLPNPYLKITVASNSYDSKERYACTWWLDLTNGFNGLKIPRFKSLEIKEYTNIADMQEGYLYYKEAEDKYVYLKDGEELKYNFRIVKTFLSSDTIQWTDKNYIYSIKLVAGQSVVDYLKGLLAPILPDTELPDSIDELVKLFDCEHKYLLKNVYLDGRPLQTIDIQRDILKQSSITVRSDEEYVGRNKIEQQ